MKYGFMIINLTNDKVIAMVPQVESMHIEQAIALHNIEIEDIGINIMDLTRQSEIVAS